MVAVGDHEPAVNLKRSADPATDNGHRAPHEMAQTTPEPEAAHANPVRLSDVDEWGRSERMRRLARQLYDPVYRSWFRVEWEGLEKIPTDGGALLVANHAGAIPH